jgi:hypothetical protein
MRTALAVGPVPDRKGIEFIAAFQLAAVASGQRRTLEAENREAPRGKGMDRIFIPVAPRRNPSL